MTADEVINKINGIINQGVFSDWEQILLDAVAIIIEQEEVIEQYHKADSFLDAHGWKWSE